jgi:predicted CXXCH cytochrome family protein
VYVYGSFLQSRMHLKGVTCSNCHDPHSTRLKLDGNAVCTQCHNPEGRAEFPSLKPASYDDPSHHFHPMGSEGAACVNCHMPARTYMGVDVRRDHSFRVPRPDLTQTLDVPNTCNACHEDRDAAWASAAIEKRYGPPPPHYATLFAAARNGAQDAEPGLAAIVTDTDQPIMVRATAASLLGAYSRGYTIDALRFASKASPLLELGAAEGAGGLSPDSQWRLLAPLLDDDRRAVRMAAFDALMPLAADPAYRARLQPHLADYLDSLQASLDFPETQVSLAAAWATFGDVTKAESALEEALTLQRSYVPALLNLADLYRATGRDADGESLLLEALGVAPDSPEAAFSYALWLTRQDRPTEALDYFQRAAAAAPDMLNYGYAYALSLNEAGQGEAAVAELKRLIGRWPNHQDLLYTLVTVLRDQGRREEALEYLDRLIELDPNDDNLRTFRERLSRVTG